MESLSEKILRSAQAADRNAVQLVHDLLEIAVAERASDLHIEPANDTVTILLRVDGVLRRVADLQPALAPYIVGRIKVLSELLTYRTDLAQEGRIVFENDGHQIAIRISVFPAAHGEKIVARIFDPVQRLKTLDSLGFDPAALSALREGLVAGEGIILFTGPAGSGKTTTIYACLAALVEVDGGRRSVVTVEDPIEFSIPGVTQTETNPRVGLTFAASLAHLLRQDPEVLMVGEIRDAETAKIAVEAGLVGHLLLSTMHCGDCAGAFTRLLDMGLEPYLVTSSVRMVVAQRLLRALCPQCRRPGESAAPVEGFGEHFEAVGCPQCLQTGYSGRFPIAEVLTMTDPLRRAILDRADSARLREIAAAERRGPSLYEAALDRVKSGCTTFKEVGRVFGSKCG